MFWGLLVYCGCKMNWAAAFWGLPYVVSLQHQSKPFITTVSPGLSATRVTTLWLKQPTCFCSVGPCQCGTMSVWDHVSVSMVQLVVCTTLLSNQRCITNELISVMRQSWKVKRPAVTKSLTQDTSVLSHECSDTELWQLAGRPPTLTILYSICTTHSGEFRNSERGVQPLVHKVHPENLGFPCPLPARKSPNWISWSNSRPSQMSGDQ